jgi:hypothetical protein
VDVVVVVVVVIVAIIVLDSGVPPEVQLWKETKETILAATSTLVVQSNGHAYIRYNNKMSMKRGERVACYCTSNLHICSANLFQMQSNSWFCQKHDIVTSLFGIFLDLEVLLDLASSTATASVQTAEAVVEQHSVTIWFETDVTNINQQPTKRYDRTETTRQQNDGRGHPL